MKVEDIKLKIISDSRGKDTLEVVLKSGDFEALASVPSGKSTGATEAAVIEPHKALEKVEFLNSEIKDREFESLEQFDKFLLSLDGTPNKQNLGGNVILALSMAFTRLLGKEQGLELFQIVSKISGSQPKFPFCFFNVINGGLHAENSLPFQEYIFIPQTNSAKQSLEAVMKAIKFLKEKINDQYGQVKMGDEGGFTVPSPDPLIGLQILQEGIGKNDLQSKIGLDVAASSMLHDDVYHVGDELMSRYELLELYKKITSKFPVLSIEDPFDEEDWEGFAKITTELGSNVWIVGDDLLTTNVSRIKKAHELKAVNAVLIKPNQIGTITETIQAVQLAKSYGWKIVVSHRSGETMDTFIADLAVGVGADGLKSGCPLQKERLVKYERLIEIESILSSRAGMTM